MAFTFSVASGNPIISTDQSKIGSTSAKFTPSVATPDEVGTPDDPAWVMGGGSGPFTIEFWLYFLNSNNCGLRIGQNDFDATLADYWRLQAFYLSGSNIFNYEQRKDAGTVFALQPTPSNNRFSSATWHHFCVSRDGSTHRLFLDGTVMDSGGGGWVNADEPSTFSIKGYQPFSGTGGTVYVDELRISTVARYTSNFVPQTTPFVPDEDTVLLMHFEGNDGSTDFIDSSDESPQGRLINAIII